MDFQIMALDAGQFRHLYGRNDAQLAEYGAKRYTVTDQPGFPCRVSLVDAEIGESVLLLNYEHQPAATPYRSSHAIFVIDGAETAFTATNEVPKQLRIRTLSVRAFDAGGMMLDADLIAGEKLEGLIERLLASDLAAYLHIHNAGRGCYAAKVLRC
jgi:hypothetical protein